MGWGLQRKTGRPALDFVGERGKTPIQMGALRLEMGNRLGLMDKHNFKPLWVVDFPLLEWDDETNRYHAMITHLHLQSEDIPLKQDPGKSSRKRIRLVINGVRLVVLFDFDSSLQAKMFPY